jgi:hypothetical protein
MPRSIRQNAAFRFAKSVFLGGLVKQRLFTRQLPRPPKPELAGKQFPEYLKWGQQHPEYLKWEKLHETK